MSRLLISTKCPPGLMRARDAATMPLDVRVLRATSAVDTWEVNSSTKWMSLELAT